MKSVSRLRKTELTQLADDMQLKVNASSKRSEILNYIRKVPYFKRHLRSYNPRDPCTLVPLHEIPAEHYIEWNQNKLVFGADIRSIRRLFDYQLFTLPFALDLVEGESTDMRTCGELTEAIKTVQPDLSDCSHEPSIACRFLFGIEKLCGGNFGYINGNISKQIINNPDTNDVHFSILNSIYNVASQLEGECQYVMYLLIDVCYYPLMWSIPTHKDNLLETILECMTFFVSIVGERGHNVIFTIFNDI